ncbi:hypothetical protein IKZ40_06670 [bacterium]|jgi:hypothetical protein|nr:hypothetical protein [bacterium]
MKRIVSSLILLFLAAAPLLAAPKDDDAWIQKAKNLKILGVSIGMTAGQVRSVLLKAPKTTLLPWAATTQYHSLFRFDLDTGFGPLNGPLDRFLDIGFAPIPTNTPKRSEMRIQYDNPYWETYPMQENHHPGNGEAEILPFISYSAKFHDFIVYTNTIYQSKKTLKVRTRAEMKFYFNAKNRVVAINVHLYNMKDDDKEAALKQLNAKYSLKMEKSDNDYYTYDVYPASGVTLQSEWKSNYHYKPTDKNAPPLNSRRWEADNFYFHEDEYMKALTEKKLRDPLMEIL